MHISFAVLVECNMKPKRIEISHASIYRHKNRMVLGHFGHGHFGLGRFGLDISATDVSATENAEGGRFGQNHKFWVWDVFMYKCVMHFIIF